MFTKDLIASMRWGGVLGAYRLTVGKGSVEQDGSYLGGYFSRSYGDLSPNTFEEKTITQITCTLNGSNMLKMNSIINIPSTYPGTIYFGRYDTKQYFEMPYTDMVDVFTTSEKILSEADIGKTIPVYIGWKPPEF